MDHYQVSQPIAINCSPINRVGCFSAENPSATANGTSNDQQFTTEITKGLDELSPNQSNCNELQNQSSNKLKESVSVLVKFLLNV